MKRFLLLLLCLAGCKTTSDFHFIVDGEPYYYIGSNMWYAAELYKTDSLRLYAELDTLSAMGVNNLRILATGEDVQSLRAALKAMSERGMEAVLYLNNSWEWSPEGCGYYLEQAGAGPQPTPATAGYHGYVDAMSEFASNNMAVALFQEHVERVVSALKDAPGIFSWQICNEPRPFSEDPKKVADFLDYIYSTAALIKSIDPSHYVSTGSEGLIGSNNDISLVRKMGECPDVDYLTIHIWPYNWQWVDAANLDSGLKAAIDLSSDYIDKHLALARELRKPLVIEEFGYPRDGFNYEYSSSTQSRDKYYEYIFSRVLESAASKDALAGCNFWAWNGYARQNGHQFYQEGDDLCGDPSHEAQGLYGVYLRDTSTVETVIRSCQVLLR